MSMMYSIIAQELEKAGLSTQYDLQDYLNFYCLGKRDAPSGGSSPINQKTDNRALVSYFLSTPRIVDMVAITKDHL